jgi:4-amino-4-deoxy-L-arabinose transferase-like glycosyltransferase
MVIAPPRRSEQRLLLFVILCILAVKLAFDLVIVPLFKDQIGSFYGIGPSDNYGWIAKNIYLGNGYRSTPDTGFTLLREPGYPYFLAALRYLFESDRGPAVIANLLFTSLSAFLISKLARLVSPQQWLPLVAPVLFLLHPGVIVAELRGGVEIPFVLLVLCFLLLLRQGLATANTVDYIKAGLVLGAASCVRSTALLFPVFLFVRDLIFERDWRFLTRSALRTALVLISALIVLSPWIIRNYLLVGQFIPTASVRGIAMQAGNYICTHAEGRKTFQELDYDAADVRNKLAAEQGYRFKAGYYQWFFDPHDEVRFNNALGQQVMQEYLQSPALLVKCATKNAFNFWFAGKNRFATIANICVQVPYMALALLGLVVGFRQYDRPTVMVLLLFGAYTVMIYMPIHAQARYSVPLVPIMAILSAIPICKLLEYRFGNRSATAARPSQV